MSMKKHNYVATFTNPMLGTKAADPEVHSKFIAQKEREQASEDELSNAERTALELEDRKTGISVFHRNAAGQPIIYNYQVKGAIKALIKAARRNPESKSAKLKNSVGAVNENVFVEPREIVLELPEGVEVERLERPLRAQTMQGERMSLKCSESVPAGTKMRFSVATDIPGFDAILAEIWERTEYFFMGEWRNSGFGTAVVEEVK